MNMFLCSRNKAGIATMKVISDADSFDHRHFISFISTSLISIYALKAKLCTNLCFATRTLIFLTLPSQHSGSASIALSIPTA